MINTNHWNCKLNLFLVVLFVASAVQANVAKTAKDLVTCGAGISISAGNKDRGVHLTLKAKKPFGSMDILLKAPGVVNELVGLREAEDPIILEHMKKKKYDILMLIVF